MAEVECLQDFKHVVPDVKVSELLVQCSKIDISSVNVLHDQGWSLGHRVSNDIDQVDDVDSIFESLQNFDLSSDFGFLDCTKRVETLIFSYLASEF